MVAANACTRVDIHSFINYVTDDCITPKCGIPSQIIEIHSEAYSGSIPKYSGLNYMYSLKSGFHCFLLHGGVLPCVNSLLLTNYPINLSRMTANLYIGIQHQLLPCRANLG